MWPFKRTKSPEQLYKEKKDEEILEGLRRSAIIVEGRSLTRLGCSEYGARKHLEEGTTPGEKVLIADGSLISWEEWKRRNV